MTILLSEVAEAVRETWRSVAGLHHDSVVHDVAGAGLYATGAPFAALNRVIITEASVRPSAVAALISEAAASDVPVTVEMRPGIGGEVRSLLAARSYHGDTRVPLMLIEDPGGLKEPSTPEGLVVEQISEDRIDEHLSVCAEGFGAPRELVEGLLPPGAWGLDGLRVYVGRLDDAPVATSIGLTAGDHVGVFSVATLDAHRGNGFGGALTARAVADGFDAGAQWAFLQSSEQAEALYERLGFSTAERWWALRRPTHEE